MVIVVQDIHCFGPSGQVSFLRLPFFWYVPLCMFPKKIPYPPALLAFDYIRLPPRRGAQLMHACMYGVPHGILTRANILYCAFLPSSKLEGAMCRFRLVCPLPSPFLRYLGRHMAPPTSQHQVKAIEDLRTICTQHITHHTLYTQLIHAGHKQQLSTSPAPQLYFLVRLLTGWVLVKLATKVGANVLDR